MVASGKRNIKSGAEYEKYFTAKPTGKEVELIADGDVYQTLDLMKKIVDQTLDQTKAISKVLKGNNVKETCENVWNFLYNHVQYTKDNPTREQLRTPIRTWKDRSKGVDCDCYSIFISSVLTNLGIAHNFRMAAYKEDFQHVYVVSSGYVIDPVVDKFNYEVPYSKKHDHKMKITTLSGPASLGNACESREIKLRKFLPTQQFIDEGKVPTLYFLNKHNIAFTPVYDKGSNTSFYMINTSLGAKRLPTVLTKQQADELLNMLTVMISTTKPATEVPGVVEDVALKNKFPWWWVALGAGAALLISNDTNVQSGLNGTK